MLVWVLIFYVAGGAVIVDNIRTQTACEVLADVMTADVRSLNGLEPPHRCVSVMKR
jgi:hypothetical protein